MPDDIVRAAIRQVELHGMKRELLDALLAEVKPGDIQAQIRKLMRALYNNARTRRKSFRTVAEDLYEITVEIDREYRRRCIVPDCTSPADKRQGDGNVCYYHSNQSWQLEEILSQPTPKQPGDCESDDCGVCSLCLVRSLE